MKRAALGLLGLCIGCASDGGNDTTAAPECFAQLKWAGGEKGSDFMSPGKDCVACHTERHEGPQFAFAGTVFGQFKQADLCEGKAGAMVEITDANGVVATLTTNEAGNFMSRGKSAPALPYTAKVRYGGKERKMATPQSNGSCNACHTVDGLNGAPGRLVAP